MQLAFLCPPFAGHLDPMLALGAALRQRGHEVSFVGLRDIAARVEAAGLRAEAVEDPRHPPGVLTTLEQRLAGLRGLRGIGAVIDDVAAMTDLLCRQAPAVLQRLRADAIVCDQLEPAGGLLASRLGLPQVSVANALMLDREPYIPPPFTDWPYARSRWALERNRGGYRVADWMMGRAARVIAQWSAAFRLPPRTRAEECLGARQIGQMSPLLDFPREALGDGFDYTGPLRPPLASLPEWHVPRDLPLASDAPLAFVSLGSLQGGRQALIGRITEACRDLGLTAVVAHNGRLSETQAAALPGEPIVQRHVPQRRVIERCRVVISHGGMNTVLDALAAGVPLVLVPLAMEQGAIAQRVQRSGAGERLSAWQASVAALRQRIAAVLERPDYRDRAARVAASLHAGGGAARAAELVERHVQHA